MPNLNELKALIKALDEEESEHAKSSFDKLDVVKHVCYFSPYSLTNNAYLFI